jgi:HK97 gp10 family phage protein
LASSSFRWDTSNFKSPKIMERKLQRAVFGVVNRWDGKIEAHMKHNAPWTDRTSNARNGLRAQAAAFSKTSYGILLTHGVTYGIYLELGTRYMRARPIIIPTMEEFGPRVVASLVKLLDRLGSRG